MAGRAGSVRSQGIMSLIFSTLLVCFVRFCDCLQCMSHSGKPVDWFIAYKLPHHRDPLPDDSFYYMDPDQPAWRLSGTTMKNHDHAVYYTLQQIYSAQKGKLNVKKDFNVLNDTLKWRSSRFILDGKDKVNTYSDSFYAMYNDELPESSASTVKRSSSYYEETGHTKGVVGFDDKTGFWLIQSTPKFPNRQKDGYAWPSNANYYGQTFLCISMATDPNIEEIGKQFLFNYPHFYDDNLPKTLSKRFPNMTLAVFGGHETKAPWKRKTLLTSLSGKKFYSYAKSTDFDADLYSAWVSLDLKNTLFVETWQNGRNKLCSNCTGPYKVYNVDTLHFNDKDVDFKETEDHAKWAVTNTTETGAWTCIGDINRQESQMKRGGGTVCTNDYNIWKAFRGLISAYHDCKPYRKCVEV